MSVTILGRAVCLGAALAVTACTSSRQAHPIPAAEMEAEARKHAPCTFIPTTSNDVLQRFAGIRFHLPRTYEQLMSEAEIGSNVRFWAAPDSTMFILGLEGAGVGYDTDVTTLRSEPPCALPVLGRSVRVDLELAQSRSRPDTMFMAAAFFYVRDEIPATVAIFGWSRDQMERLLGSVAGFAVDPH